MLRLLFVAMTLAVLETSAIADPMSAEDLYTEGQAAYDRKDFPTAIVKWQASYDLSSEAGLLFNLAQAKRLAGDCVGAIATYRNFDTMDADSTSTQHKLAKDFVRELDGTCPEQKPAIVPILKDASIDREFSRERSGRAWKIAGLVTSGVGIATIVIGLGLGHHGASIGDEITAACTTSCDWTTLKNKDARGKRAVSIGKALDVVGIAAIAGGAIFYYLGVRRETLTVVPAPGGGVVSWSGSW